MEVWIECGDQFIATDVIRWTEAVFEKQRRGRKPLFLGELEVVAEVISNPDSKGVLMLLVRRCKIVALAKNASTPFPPLLDSATEIRRQKRTLLKNGLHRLVLPDESARAIVASRFLNEGPPRSAPEARPLLRRGKPGSKRGRNTCAPRVR